MSKDNEHCITGADQALVLAYLHGSRRVNSAITYLAETIHNIEDYDKAKISYAVGCIRDLSKASGAMGWEVTTLITQQDAPASDDEIPF
jgi:hypothetical protein